MILEKKPDILITDIKMPFMDGLELSEQVKKVLPATKIMILSGYNEFDYAKMAIKIGVTDYLLKPISSEKLLDAVNKVAEEIRKEQSEKEQMNQYAREMQELSLIHISEPTRLGMISYAVFCLKKKKIMFIT